MRLKIKLGPKTQEVSRKEVINDGGWILRKTDGSGQGDVPLVSYEVSLVTKFILFLFFCYNYDINRRYRRNVNDTVRHTGQEECFQNESLTQELAELLGIALVDFNPGCGDQEAYVVTIHGTQMRLVAARFTEEYLWVVQKSCT